VQALELMTTALAEEARTAASSTAAFFNRPIRQVRQPKTHPIYALPPRIRPISIAADLIEVASLTLLNLALLSSVSIIY